MSYAGLHHAGALRGEAIIGGYDFLIIAEAPSEMRRAAVLMAAASGAGVTDLRTTLAINSIEAKGPFAADGDLAPGFPLCRRPLARRVHP